MKTSTKNKPIIYVIDDNLAICQAIQDLLTMESFEIQNFYNPEIFLKHSIVILLAV